MYEVEFYYDKNGKSEIVDFLDELQAKSKTSKTDRINREKMKEIAKAKNNLKDFLERNDNI